MTKKVRRAIRRIQNEIDDSISQTMANQHYNFLMDIQLLIRYIVNQKTRKSK